MFMHMPFSMGTRVASLCRGLWHNKLRCDQTAATTEMWFQWIRQDREAYLRRTQQQLEQAKQAEQAFNAAVQEAMRRWVTPDPSLPSREASAKQLPLSVFVAFVQVS